VVDKEHIMKKSPYKTTLSAILIFLLTTVCNLPTDRSISPTQIVNATPTPSDYLIPETTKVLDSNLQESLESVSPEGIIVFSRTSPALESLETGDILVSDPAQAAPDGFLRKVRTVRVEGEKVIIETDDAELIEAVHEGHVAFVQDLRAEDIRSTWLYPGVTFHGTNQANQSASYHLTSLIPSSSALRPSPLSYTINTDFGTGGRVKVIGNASLEPKLEADVNISCNDKVFGVCAEIPDLNFMTRIAIIENVSLSVVGDATNFNKRIEIARHEFKPLTFWIGPVPVVFTPILSVYLQGDGVLTSKVEYAIGQRLTLAAGFRYNSDKGFENLSEATFDYLKPTPTFLKQVDLRGVIGGEFKLLLYGAIGPYASLEAGPRFRANIAGLPSEPAVLWRAEGCIWLFVGIDSVKIIKLRYQKELYKSCLSFAEGLNQPPNVDIQSPNQGTQVYQGETVKLRATVFDSNGGNINCSWTSNQAGDPFPISACEQASVTFNTPGSRTLKLTATDSAGASGTDSVSFEVLPPPNILVTINNPADGGTVGPDETITLSASASGGRAPYQFTWSIVYPTDAAGNGGAQYNIGSGENVSWAPSNSISFGGCEVNSYGKLVLNVLDSNGFSGIRTIVIAIMRIC
jgi:hypothetical protein